MPLTYFIAKDMSYEEQLNELLKLSPNLLSNDAPTSLCDVVDEWVAYISLFGPPPLPFNKIKMELREEIFRRYAILRLFCFQIDPLFELDFVPQLIENPKMFWEGKWRAAEFCVTKRILANLVLEVSSDVQST